MFELLLRNVSQPEVPVAPRVEIVQVGGKYELRRDGQPYFIKGAGCSNSNDEMLQRLSAAGGNSIRTWGADNAGELLDRAQRHGISVTLGYWLGHVAHGFKWDDPKMLAEQEQKIRDTVAKHKDHPSLLMWALGNEMEINNDNDQLWTEVGRLAKIVKSIDPNHPVTTVIADCNKEKAERIKRLAPDVDILGVNSYGGLATLPTRLREYGWTKPFMVTEYGPLGQWEVPKNAFGMTQEQTSTEKAKRYREMHEQKILGNPGWCLGGYAFIWGNKQEETATWFGMHLPTGENLQAVDEMTRLWSGRYPANRSPQIRSVRVSPKNDVAKGAEIEFVVDAFDPDRDALHYEYVLRHESTDKKIGGYPEKAPPTVFTRDAGDSSRLRFRMPEYPGEYRIFVYIRDGKGNAATANVSLRAQ
ncbi:MAG: glycoside hydrolase family 2 TIM barrel-domain containing protein [Fimbriimonadaceae bacterium]|nr:glycoside hydrolase family 2 TIM barrel-domain containing protein [Fimbriimonadaceae bacterium]